MKWNPRRTSPAAIAIWTAAFIILFLLSIHRISTRRNHFTALVEIASPVVENASAAPKTLPAAPRLPDGEVERTALRVREVSALVIGLTLFVVNEGLNRRSILNVGALT